MTPIRFCTLLERTHISADREAFLRLFDKRWTALPKVRRGS